MYVLHVSPFFLSCVGCVLSCEVFLCFVVLAFFYKVKMFLCILPDVWYFFFFSSPCFVRVLFFFHSSFPVDWSLSVL